jgi:hypothetical protein
LKVMAPFVAVERHTRAGAFRRGTVRGVASLEVAIFLPVLVLVFAGILLVIRQSRATMQARSQARSCAWRISATGCDETPPDCSNQKVLAPTSDSAKERLERAGVGDDIQGSEVATLEIENRLDGLLVERNTSVVHVPYRRPALLAPGKDSSDSTSSPLNSRGDSELEVVSTAEYRLPCNSLPTEAKNLVEALFGEFSP